MAIVRRVVDYILLLFAVQHLCHGLKFVQFAYPGSEAQKHERCIRNFAEKETMVMVTVTVDGNSGDGQQVNVHIKDAVGNDHNRMKDVVGEKKKAHFTTHTDAAIDVCFENVLTSRASGPPPSRNIELDVDIGADAKDWSSIQNDQGLKPIEVELRHIEEVTKEIVQELEYLREREVKLRDTNESTNERVKWFALGTMGMLVALGIWQVLYLRAYFRSKHLI